MTAPTADAVAQARGLRERLRNAAEAGWDETLTAEELLVLLDAHDAELEAARAVVEWARGMIDDPQEQPGPLVRAYDKAVQP